MAQEITVGGSGLFKPTTLGTSQSYSLSAATSPLVLTPPPGKVVRLDTLLISGGGITLSGTSIDISGDEIISGTLSYLTATAGNFCIGSPPFGTTQPVDQGNSAAYKEAIVAFEKDQPISISTTDATAETVYYSVSYGDL